MQEGLNWHAWKACVPHGTVGSNPTLSAKQFNGEKMGNLGPTEIIIIVLGILVLFGAKKIPEFAKGLGKGMKEFKKAINDVNDEVKQVEDNPDQKKKD